MGRLKSIGNLQGRRHSIYLSVRSEIVFRSIVRKLKEDGLFYEGWLNEYVSKRLYEDFGISADKEVLLYELNALQDEAQAIHGRLADLAAKYSQMKKEVPVFDVVVEKTGQ